jgi:hypothetical protein
MTECIVLSLLSQHVTEYFQSVFKIADGAHIAEFAIQARSMRCAHLCSAAQDNLVPDMEPTSSDPSPKLANQEFALVFEAANALFGTGCIGPSRQSWCTYYRSNDDVCELMSILLGHFSSGAC